MTPEQIAALHAELTTDPTNAGYAQHIPDAPGMIAEMLTRQTTIMRKPAYYTARGLLADMPLDEVRALLTCLKLAAAQDPVVEVAYDTLKTVGLDVAHPNIGLMLGQFVALGMIGQAVADSVEALTMQPASRAEVLLGVGKAVTTADVIAAMEG